MTYRSAAVFSRPASRALATCASVLLITACNGHAPAKTGADPGGSAAGAVIKQSNHYDAPRATLAPVIDGIVDEIWDKAPWQAVDVLWLGAQKEYPSPDDYQGKFKALWDENRLYVLMEITDDVLVDHYQDPLDNYWNDDTVEIFIDEDASGGKHHEENFANAWAYHISIHGDVIDTGPQGPTSFKDHVDVVRKSVGSKHVWEMSFKVFADDYVAKEGAVNEPVKLTQGKKLGFSVSYIDSDHSIAPGNFERESMLGSVDTPGHKDNLGYLNADVLGTLTLTE